MRGAAFLLFVLISLFAVPASAADRDIAFETIPLRHLRAGEIAGLLGPRFQYAGALRSPEGGERDSRHGGLVPEGVKLITASHQSSRYLLAAGTAEAVAELRALIGRFDVEQPVVQLRVKIYPSLATKESGWHDIPPRDDVEVAARALAADEQLRFPALPRPFKPHEITVNAIGNAPEFVALPVFKGWPQVLLCVAPDAEVEKGGAVLVGVGLLDEGSGSPAEAVQQAWEMPATQSLLPGESLALRLSRENSGITVVITPNASASGG